MMLICGVETSVLNKKTKKLCWSPVHIQTNVNKYKLVFTKKGTFMAVTVSVTDTVEVAIELW